MMKMTADIILINGTIVTQDVRQPQVRAIAVRGKKILDAGLDERILKFQNKDTRVIDLENRLVLPGFIDTHFHFYEWAQNYNSIDFSKTTSFEQMQEQVKLKAQSLGEKLWVLGQGFNESDWPQSRMPDRMDLDAAAPENPVCIWRCDLHLAVANSMALEMAGIDPKMPDPPDGVIVKDPAGYPTGVLKELAPDLVRRAVPPLDGQTLLSNMRKAMSDAHKLGLTSIHDIRLMGGKEGKDALRAWQHLRQEDQLCLRCHVALPGEMTREAISLGLMTGFGDDLLKIGHLKFFSDGGMGARTGWMLEPYLDADLGMPLTAVSRIEQAVAAADQAGLSAMVHAIGDRANREVINMFKRIEEKAASRCRVPHRIEHMQMVRPEDLKTLSTLKNVVVTCQPNNMSLDISMIDACVGELGRYTYPIKSILNAGLPVMLGSDAPVADKNPLAGIYSAVTRRRMDYTPEKGWYMKEALSVDEAVRGYTLSPAVGSRTDAVIGSLSPGKFADLVVLDRNIYAVDAQKIASAKADMTMFNGKIVYDRG